jgi:cytochrome c oxidase subunit 3
MPATFTRSPAEVDRKDTGIGGRPPLDRRPTGGGGGGDDWDGRSSRRRGPRHLISSYRLTLICALGVDLMFFFLLTVTFVAGRGMEQAHLSSVPAGMNGDFALPPILWINTALLLLSSITMEKARRPLFCEIDIMEEWLGMGRPAARRSLPWLILTCILGVLFLFGQWMAWNQLGVQGIHYSSSINSHFFFLITETQALHIGLGIVALASSVAGLVLLRKVLWRQILIDCTAWYWQAMGALWLGLFIFLICGL